MTMRARRLQRTHGFTLLELLVVMAIAALIVGLVPPAITRVMPGLHLKAASQDLAKSLWQARNLAVARGRTTDVLLRKEPPSYRIGEERFASLPEHVELSGEPAGADEYRLRFYADGSSSGGKIVLKGPNGRYALDVDWLTGRVKIDTDDTDEP